LRATYFKCLVEEKFKSCLEHGLTMRRYKNMYSR
jgi:hypothetical protein